MLVTVPPSQSVALGHRGGMGLNPVHYSVTGSSWVDWLIGHGFHHQYTKMNKTNQMIYYQRQNLHAARSEQDFQAEYSNEMATGTVTRNL